MHTIIQRQGKQDGFTLLEVLIALLVLSIGLLGLAGLQTTALRSNQMAGMRTLAIQHAYGISDRMRANPTGVDAQLYVQNVTATVPTGTTVNCTMVACTPAQLAAFDLTAWMNEVVRLPGGRGRITRDASGTFVMHTVTVFWDEERREITGTNCGPDPDIDLRCIQLTL